MPGGPSGTVLFSVESLLYYAPRITGIGKDLASAESTAQNQLLGLGAFWGGAWPDAPFAKAYQPSQYAALIMVGQLAIEIQGIGGGVEQMARNYGITEDTNTEDVRRIAANQAATSDLISASGGIGNPPDTARELPVVSASGPMPHPQPNLPPGSTPAPTPSASQPAVTATPSPTGSPMPSPQPGPGAPKSWQVMDATSVFGPWPSGDPDKMDMAATYWGALISQLDDAWSGLTQTTDYILADAEGPAANAFYDYVDGLTNRSTGSLSRAIEVCQYLQDACTAQATSLRNIKRALELAIAELAASLIIGLALAYITFATSEYLSLAVANGILDFADSLIADIVAEGTELAGNLEQAAQLVSRVLGAATAAAYQGSIIGLQTVVANNALAEAFGQQGTYGTAALESVLNATWQDALGGSFLKNGALNETAAVLSKNLIDVGEESGSTALIVLGRQLKAGSITVAAADQTITQLIQNGTLNPVQLVSGTVSNRLGTALGPNTGSHAKL
jgi:hypothetical protein